jgi:hypothetical protein
MSCESCRDLLIELVCDELPLASAAEVRAHALRCERCGPELEKLSATLRVSRDLPLLTPSPEVERRVMQAARDAIARRARGPAREETSVPAGGRLTAWFARLGSFAMSPQVAMASVLLLVVGIGLYALPLGHDPEPSALRVAEDEAPDEQGAPAASPAASATAVPVREGDEAYAVPAERLAKETEKNARASSYPSRDKAYLQEGTANKAEPGGGKAGSGASAQRAFPESKGALGAESKLRGASSEPRPRAPAKSAPSKAATLDDTWGDSNSDYGSARRDVAAEARNQVPPLAKQAAAQPEKSKRAERPADAVGSAAAGAPASQAPFAPAPPAPVAAAPSARKPSAEAESASEMSKQSAPLDAPKEEAAHKKDAAVSPLSQGIAAVQRGDHSLGQELLLPLLSSGSASDRSQARLWLARSLRARGDCVHALEHYRVLTQSVSAARAVLEEAADCQDRTGNAAAASKLRSRAALPTKQ